MKKLLSIILTISILLTVSVVGVSAVLEPTGEYTPDDGAKTSRYYFYMPQEWCNEYSDTAGVYWWDGTDACGIPDGSGENLQWPGYKATESEEKNIFYIDCPSDVNIIIWNNYINGGFDYYAEIYQKAKKAEDSPVEFYADGDTEVYTTEFFKYVEESFYGDKKALGKYADNFFIDKVYDCGMSFTMDNMIYILDCDMQSRCMSDWYDNCYGVWYFYYGNREYGTYPLKEDAEKYGMVGTLPSYDPIYTPEETIPFEENIPATEPTTEPTTVPVTNPEDGNFIYFDVKGTGWSNVEKVFCHIWRPDGTGDAHSWQSKKELCEYDKSTGIASYDLSKLNFPVTSEDGKEFCVIFSANTGSQTYYTVMSGSCIGDTMYCIEDILESPEDSEKRVLTALWRNNPDCGPLKRITTKGEIIGTAHPDGESDETILADYLIKYYNDYEKTERTQQLVNQLGVYPDDVMQAVRERVVGFDAEEKIEAIEKILATIEAPKKQIECDINSDGYTNIIDATLIQKFAVELEPFTSSQLKTADLNSDGYVNVVDATILQKSLAGI